MAALAGCIGLVGLDGAGRRGVGISLDGLRRAVAERPGAAIAADAGWRRWLSHSLRTMNSPPGGSSDPSSGCGRVAWDAIRMSPIAAATRIPITRVWPHAATSRCTARPAGGGSMAAGAPSSPGFLGPSRAFTALRRPVVVSSNTRWGGSWQPPRCRTPTSWTEVSGTRSRRFRTPFMDGRSRRSRPGEPGAHSGRGNLTGR